LVEDTTSRLLSLLYQAHEEVALRDNPSKEAVRLAAMGSGLYFNAIAAALMTYGGVHGPLVQTYDLLTIDEPFDHIDLRLRNGFRIPGWGNGYHKDGVEPAFVEVKEELKGVNPRLHDKIDLITGYIQDEKKLKLYPNPACFTAATAITTGIPREAVGVLVVQARLIPWTNLFMETIIGGNKV